MRAAKATWLAVAALAVTAGCGDDDASDEPAAKPVGEEITGSVVQYADCTDWRKGTVAEREATIDELRGQLTAQTDATEESPLQDDTAYEILDSWCKAEFADKLRLYKIYARVQGFSPLYEQ